MKNKQTVPCPQCGHELNPASMLGKLSAMKRKPTSEQMKALQAKRVYKTKKV